MNHPRIRPVELQKQIDCCGTSSDPAFKEEGGEISEVLILFEFQILIEARISPPG